jgi:hypothetical protein
MECVFRERVFDALAPSGNERVIACAALITLLVLAESLESSFGLAS